MIPCLSLRPVGLMPATVRVRLTLLYSGLFLLTSTIVLTVANLLLKSMIDHQIALIPASSGPPAVAVPGKAGGATATAPPGSALPAHTGAGPSSAGRMAASRLAHAVLGYQWSVTAITIAVLTLISVAVGWWLAGRLLNPLDRITATARRLSLSNLHERIALAGPRNELKDLADTFDAMLARLERSVDSQRRFIANAAHELRTPLATQRAAIQIGLDDPLPAHLVPVRHKLLSANRRTERLIEALFILAQAEHGLDSTQPVNLDQLTRRAVGETAADGVTLTLDIEPTTIEGDPVLLGRLLANLLHNAVRYNHPGGEVHLTLKATGILTIRNAGPHVPPDRVAELFEPFRRLHATRTRTTDGTGLGLSIVASIVRAHHATVTACPNPGGGLEMTIRFPAAVTGRQLRR